MENKDASELTVREASILALDRSQECFSQMKETAAKLAALFSTGLDQEALILTQKELYPSITALYNFSIALVERNSDVLGKDLVEDFAQLFEKSDILVGEMSKFTEAGNFVEIGILLETRFISLMDEFAKFFPMLSERFRISDNSDLDKY